jgi:hypothetical protein
MSAVASQGSVAATVALCRSWRIRTATLRFCLVSRRLVWALDRASLHACLIDRVISRAVSHTHHTPLPNASRPFDPEDAAGAASSSSPLCHRADWQFSRPAEGRPHSRVIITW